MYVDYNLGNKLSVKNTFKAGFESVITNSHAEIKKASALVLPGVGSFKEEWKI